MYSDAAVGGKDVTVIYDRVKSIRTISLSMHNILLFSIFQVSLDFLRAAT